MYADLNKLGRVPVDSDLIIKEVCQEWCQHLDVVLEQGSWHNSIIMRATVPATCYGSCPANESIMFT